MEQTAGGRRRTRCDAISHSVYSLLLPVTVSRADIHAFPCRQLSTCLPGLLCGVFLRYSQGQLGQSACLRPRGSTCSPGTHLCSLHFPPTSRQLPWNLEHLLGTHSPYLCIKTREADPSRISPGFAPALQGKCLSCMCAHACTRVCVYPGIRTCNRLWLCMHTRVCLCVLLLRQELHRVGRFLPSGRSRQLHTKQLQAGVQSRKSGDLVPCCTGP